MRIKKVAKPHIFAGQRGFSLVELMVVVAIMGVLTKLAMPMFSRYTAVSKQLEAKSNVMMISTLQETYYGDNGAYWNGCGVWGDALMPIGFKTTGKARYNYSTASDCAQPVGPYGNTYVIGSVAMTQDDVRPGCGCYDNWWYTSYQSPPGIYAQSTATLCDCALK